MNPCGCERKTRYIRDTHLHGKRTLKGGQRAKGQAEVWRDGEQTGDSLITLAWSCTKFANFSSTVISVLYRSVRTALLAAFSIAPIHWLHCVLERAHKVCERPAHVNGRNISFTTCMIENRKHPTLILENLPYYIQLLQSLSYAHARAHTPME